MNDIPTQCYVVDLVSVFPGTGADVLRSKLPPASDTISITAILPEGAADQVALSKEFPRISFICGHPVDAALPVLRPLVEQAQPAQYLSFQPHWLRGVSAALPQVVTSHLGKSALTALPAKRLPDKLEPWPLADPTEDEAIDAALWTLHFQRALNAESSVLLSKLRVWMNQHAPKLDPKVNPVAQVPRLMSRILFGAAARGLVELRIVGAGSDHVWLSADGLLAVTQKRAVLPAAHIESKAVETQTQEPPHTTKDLTKQSFDECLLAANLNPFPTTHKRLYDLLETSCSLGQARTINTITAELVGHLRKDDAEYANLPVPVLRKFVRSVLKMVPVFVNSDQPGKVFDATTPMAVVTGMIPKFQARLEFAIIKHWFVSGGRLGLTQTRQFSGFLFRADKVTDVTRIEGHIHDLQQGAYIELVDDEYQLAAQPRLVELASVRRQA